MSTTSDQTKSYPWIFIPCGFLYGVLSAAIRVDQLSGDVAYAAGTIVGGAIFGVLLWSVLGWIAKRGYMYVAIFIGFMLVVSLVWMALSRPSSGTQDSIDKESITTGCVKTCTANWSRQTNDVNSPVWGFNKESVASMCNCGCSNTVTELSGDQLKELLTLPKGSAPSPFIQDLMTKNLQSCYVDTVKLIQGQAKRS